MGIAKTHRIATQLVGIQLSGANLLALAVSAASIVAGTLTLAAQKYPFNWLLLLAAGVIGLGLALLIEGLTLGSLIRIRLANRTISQIEEQFDHEMSLVLATLTIPDPSQPDAHRAIRQYRQTVRLVQHDARRKCRRASRLPRKQRRFSLPFATMGAIASAAAGGLFYHTILAGLGAIESIILAVLFPLVVTGTFLSSEIQKDAQEEAIKEGFAGGALTETAIREETKLQSALAVHQKVVAYLEKPEAEQAIEAGAKSLLDDILTELSETSRHFTRQSEIPEEPSDKSRPQSLVLSPQPRRYDSLTSTKRQDNQGGDRAPDDHDSPTSTERHDNQGDTRRHRSPALPQTQRPDDHDSTAWQHASQNGPGEHDIPAIALIQPDDTSQRNVVVGNHLIQDDTPSDQERQRQKPEPLSNQNASRSFPKATPAQTEPDMTTTRILAYLAEHKHAKQGDVAAALGITIRTVQRKLAAFRQQESARL